MSRVDELLVEMIAEDELRTSPERLNPPILLSYYRSLWTLVAMLGIALILLFLIVVTRG